MKKCTFLLIISATSLFANAQKYKHNSKKYAFNDTLSLNVYVMPFKLLKENLPSIRLGFEAPIKSLHVERLAMGGELGIFDKRVKLFDSYQLATGFDMRVFVKGYTENDNNSLFRIYAAPTFYYSSLAEMTDNLQQETIKHSTISQGGSLRLGFSYRSHKRFTFDAFAGLGAQWDNLKSTNYTTGKFEEHNSTSFLRESGISFGYVID
ncbi:MAG: hypothetical protein EXR21_01620 [Flavobacteriaceae bacterium]|nr:hypothetical protein [Flavobacteriaceae bacterium]